MFEKYTEAARRVIFYARYEASRLGAEAIGPEHLLLGLLREDKRSVARFLPRRDDAGSIRRRVDEQSAPPPDGTELRREMPLSDDAKKVLAHAHEESHRLSHRHIGMEHLFLGLLCVPGTLAERVLRESGVSLDGARERIGAAGEDATPSESSGRAATWEALASYGRVVGSASRGMKIDHIGIATAGIDDALRFWRDALGLEVTHTETVEEQGVRVAMLPLGEPRVELLEPTGPASPVAKFLEKRGPGIHHIAVRVADIRAALARLKEQGARLIDETPRVGAGRCLVAFVHPSSAGGVLLELVEQHGQHHTEVTEER
jgi:methylmalonyl-CoA epimerase